MAPPPLGDAEGIMLLFHVVRVSVCALRCFRDIYVMHWRSICTELLSVVHLGSWNNDELISGQKVTVNSGWRRPPF